MTLIQRAAAPTPRFFTRVRTGGLLMASIGATLLAAPPNSLPPAVMKLAGYLTLAGSIATAISQVTTAGEDTTNPVTGNGQ